MRGDAVAAGQPAHPPGDPVELERLAEPHVLQAYQRWDKPMRALASLERAVSLAPHRADLRRLYGNLLRRSGNHRRAVAELTEARSLAPDDPRIACEALLARLIAGQRSGDQADLVAALEQPVAGRTSALIAAMEGDMPRAEQAIKASRHPVDRLIHGVLLLARDETAEAVAPVEMVAAQEQLPRTVRAYASFYLGIARLQRRELEPAAWSLETARELGIAPEQLQPYLAWVYQQLAIDASLSEDLAAAAEYFRKLAELGGPEAAAARDNAAYTLGLEGQERAREGDYDGAAEVWSQALAIAPGDVSLRQNLAVALERAGWTEEAILHWHELVRQMPRETSGASKRGGEAKAQAGRAQADTAGEDPMRNHIRAVAHRHLADLYLEQQEYDRAIEQLERSLKAVPADIETRRMLAQLLMDEGRTKKALPHLQQLVAESPNLAMDHLELGLALLDVESEREGLEHLEKALELEPDNPAVQSHLGAALVRRVSRSPSNATAIEEAQRSVGLLPPRYVGLGWLALGAAQLARGDSRGAKKSFKEAVRGAPNKALAVVKVGQAYWDAGDHEAATTAWTDAMKRAKRLPDIYVELAYVWALAGNVERCRECLEAVMDTLGPEMILGLGEVMVRSREVQPALRAALRAMISVPRGLLERVFLLRMLVRLGDVHVARPLVNQAALEAVETESTTAITFILELDLKHKLLDRKTSRVVADWLDSIGYWDEPLGAAI